LKDFIIYSDEELIQEIKADNMFAFEVFYKKYCKRVYKFGYSILKSSDEAENLTQDVFLNLWENRHKVEKDSSIKFYVYEFVEYLKSLQEINEEPVNVEFEYNELTIKLDKIIEALPQRQKEVYLLHRVGGLKYNEIAERLHISINTIENHMSRALKTIREKLGNYSLISMLFSFLFI
jgi:RNA polymerase sigma factor (sigma-70 family)